MIYQHREVEPLKEGILDISSTQKLNEVIERLNELSFEIYSDAPKECENCKKHQEKYTRLVEKFINDIM